MYTAISGQIAAYRQIEVIANNLANMNTAGFRAERLLFEKAFKDAQGVSGDPIQKDLQAPSKLDTHDFVRLRGSYTDFTQGPIEVTNNALDVAIQGPGFFTIQTAEGEKLTRSGNFKLDAQSRLVTQAGDAVLGQGGEIFIQGAGAVQISSDGTVKVGQATAGRLRVVSAEGQMRRDARMLFTPEANTVVSDLTQFEVKGGALESSNVNAVRELTDMIMASRLFESYKAAQDSSSKMNEQRNQYVGSVQG